MQQSRIIGKCSVSANCETACCKYCSVLVNQRTRSKHKRAKRKTLRTHRMGR